MLTHIHIKDFAIVDELELELGTGMTALTGETGAGKSILVDALGLALGDRGDAGVVRHGAERAEVSAGFDLAHAPDALAFLQAQELDMEADCLVRRTISREGRSRGYINGRPVPMQSLKELGDRLVDIHSQHEHQSLLRRDTQRQLLDDYAGDPGLVQEVARLYRDWKTKTQELEALRGAADERTARLELLRFQVRELDELDPQDDEAARLHDEHSRLAHAGQLLETCHGAVTDLYENDEGTVHGQLSRIVAALDPVCDIDPALNTTRDMLNEALIQVQEAADELRHYAERLDLDPGRLEWLDTRLGSFHQLARKHRVDPDELPRLRERLHQELETLDHADEHVDALQDAVQTLRNDYRERARQLGRKRRDASRALNRQVTDAIQHLGMAGARFEIGVDARDSDDPAPSGLETVEYRVSTNPGQPLKPLTKVASGGELSRVSLALQVVLANNTRIPTLIYDEVDTGIGGGVAEVVGQQLRQLGDVRQVLCVTHLPQVAAQAHHHMEVHKQTVADETRTGIRELDPERRVDEVARMLGGTDITDQSRAHAREMIKKGQGTRAQPGSGRRRAKV